MMLNVDPSTHFAATMPGCMYGDGTILWRWIRIASCKILNKTQKQTPLRKPSVSLQNYGLDNVGYVFQGFSLFIGDKPAFSTK